MMKRHYRIGMALAALALLGGFSGPFSVWSGFRAPAPSDYRHADTTAPCPAVGLQNLSAERSAALLAALADVCDILADPEFARRIRNEPEWLADCLPGRRPGKPMAGAAVAAALAPPRTPFSVVARKPWRAVAVTNLNYPAIAIRKRRFDAWASGVPRRQAQMIETLAHEMAHLVPESDGSRRSLFKDGGHVDSSKPADAHKCLNSKLVSYDSGRIVADIWLEQRTAAAAAGN